MSLIRRGVSLLREEGIISFINGVLAYLRRQIVLHRGFMSLSVGGTTVRFVANEEYVVSKTKSRLQEEKYELESILEEIGDDVFYDIGANTGLYSCFVANVSSSCQVVAFEPYPPNVSEIERNIELNGSEQVSVFDVALSDRSGTISFSSPDKPTPGHGTGSIAEEENCESVRTVRGDELISDDKAPSPDVVKIDVEGAEPLVVDGLRNALSDDSCRLVFCELHPSRLPEYDCSTSKMVHKFEQMGYDIELHKRWSEGNDIEARRN